VAYADSKGGLAKHQSFRGAYANRFVKVFNSAQPITNHKADEVIVTTNGEYESTLGYIALFRAGCATHVWQTNPARIKTMQEIAFPGI
jgi:hypothetical protein